MVKVIGVNPNGYLVVIRLGNGTIMRIREDSFEFERIPDRPRERKHIDYEDLLAANDFIVETRRLLPKLVDSTIDPVTETMILDKVELLIQRIYKPMILCPPPRRITDVRVQAAEGAAPVTVTLIGIPSKPIEKEAELQR